LHRARFEVQRASQPLWYICAVLAIAPVAFCIQLARRNTHEMDNRILATLVGLIVAAVVVLA